MSTSGRNVNAGYSVRYMTTQKIKHNPKAKESILLDNDLGRIIGGPELLQIVDLFLIFFNKDNKPTDKNRIGIKIPLVFSSKYKRDNVMNPPKTKLARYAITIYSSLEKYWLSLNESNMTIPDNRVTQMKARIN
jgi:hypothetical protein